MHKIKLNLTDVQKQIADWRATKKPGNMVIPAIIKNNIISLNKQYSSSTICKVCSISGSQYKEWLADQNSKINNQIKESTIQTFKKIILPTINVCHATIENQNGCRLTIQLPSAAELKILIANFIAGDHHASIS